MKSYRYKSKKRGILIAIAVIALFGASAVALEKLEITNFYDKKPVSNEPEVRPTNSINYEPPTDQEISETEQHKRSIDSQNNTVEEERAPSGVTPIITSADQTTVRAYISGISEDGGTCTATFTQGTVSFPKQSSGFRDVNSTICEPIRLDRSDFNNGGEWSVVIAYKSSLVEGKSQEVKIKVN